MNIEKPTPHHRQRGEYRWLDRFLYGVRWSQHFLAILAEILILVSFAMSGMDVSLGGIMADVPLLKVLWAAMFALGIDTAFALSWVRVRQCVVGRRWWTLSWNLLLALGMAVIVFEPIAIQLLEQSLDVGFNQAVAGLGINLVFLTYARAAVAVFLGAILAMTNVESEVTERHDSSGPRRRLAVFDRLLNRIAPVVGEAPVQVREDSVPDISELPTEALPVLPALLPLERPVRLETTPDEREARVGQLHLSSLSNAERIARIVALFPDVSDRELGKLSGVSAATAKKYREPGRTPAARGGVQ